MKSMRMTSIPIKIRMKSMRKKRNTNGKYANERYADGKYMNG